MHFGSRARSDGSDCPGSLYVGPPVVGAIHKFPSMCLSLTLSFLVSPHIPLSMLISTTCAPHIPLHVVTEFVILIQNPRFPRLLGINDPPNFKVTREELLPKLYQRMNIHDPNKCIHTGTENESYTDCFICYQLSSNKNSPLGTSQFLYAPII